MSELVKRAAALRLYQRWFYAPRYTARRCVERLSALGFVWDGQHWLIPPVDIFVRAITRGDP